MSINMLSFSQNMNPNSLWYFFAEMYDTKNNINVRTKTKTQENNVVKIMRKLKIGTHSDRFHNACGQK